MVTASCDPCITHESIVCHCLKITEGALLAAMDQGEMHSVRDIRRHTGAGDGCTACHCTLKRYLQQRARDRAPATDLMALSRAVDLTYSTISQIEVHSASECGR